MKSYKMNNKKAFIISVILAAILSAPIIADDIKRAIYPPLGLFLLNSTLYILLVILLFNTLKKIIVKY